MDRIASRLTPQIPTSLRAGSGGAPAEVQGTGHSLQSDFDLAAKGARASAPGAWRAPPDSELGKAISTMLARMRECPVTLKGDTVESLFTRAVLDNPRVTNEQLLAMTRVRLDQLADSPEDRRSTLERIPNARELPSHKFTVAMLAAVTGIPPEKLSEATPSLGMTGAPGTPLLYAPKSPRMQRSTALHDFTDYLRGAGIQGLNKAVWGVENRILSALVSALGGGRY